MASVVSVYYTRTAVLDIGAGDNDTYLLSLSSRAELHSDNNFNVPFHPNCEHRDASKTTIAHSRCPEILARGLWTVASRFFLVACDWLLLVV